MSVKLPPIMNMPSGVDFLPALAAGLDAHFGDELNHALILLPTRRAVRNLSEAFTMLARENGRAARLLPPMRTLADICLLYTSPSPRDQRGSRMPSSA